MVLNNLRFFSNVYFHGHTVGGTNPSLLEAMGSYALICAHENIFNQSILKEDAFYFANANDVSRCLITVNKQQDIHKNKIFLNIEKIRRYYNWNRIIEQYESHFKEIIGVPEQVAVPAAPVNKSENKAIPGSALA